MKKDFLCILLLATTSNLMAFQLTAITKAAYYFIKTVTPSRIKTVSKAATQLGKCANAIPEREITKLAQLVVTEPRGLKEVNQILSKANYIGKYGSLAGNKILSDDYLRIAVKNGRLSTETANEIIKHLDNTPGLSSLLSKINSSSAVQVKGHLKELEIALAAKKRGFSTISLGQKFSDGIKKGFTDLDVLLSKNGQLYAIESKAYKNKVTSSMVKSDALSLLAFCKKNKGTIPVFCFETAPSNVTLEFLAKNKIQCIVGSDDEIIAKLDILATLK